MTNSRDRSPQGWGIRLSVVFRCSFRQHTQNGHCNSERRFWGEGATKVIEPVGDDGGGGGVKTACFWRRFCVCCTRRRNESETVSSPHPQNEAIKTAAQQRVQKSTIYFISSRSALVPQHEILSKVVVAVMYTQNVDF